MKIVAIAFSIFVLLEISSCTLFGNSAPTEAEITPINSEATPVETTEMNPTSAPLPIETQDLLITESVALQPLEMDVDYSSSVYLDDRSTPAALVLSITNALNRHEWIRAFSYWTSPVESLGTVDDISSQFEHLSSVIVIMAEIFSEGAAGSIYYTVPSVFNITFEGGLTQKYSACFLLRFPQPANYGEPPITPLHVEQGGFQAVLTSVSDADALADACSGVEYSAAGLGNPETKLMEDLTDLSDANYIDNRSGAVEVVSSYINAVNRKEYARAFSYWQENGIYQVFANGFSDTHLITASFGEVVSDAGAGQWYYNIPVSQVVQTTSGDTQTFVGCMTLHLSNPAFQATLPFEPLGIKDSHFSLVPNGSDLVPLLVTACD